MSGVVDLGTLLRQMSPMLNDGEYVFCSVEGDLVDYQYLNPIATFREAEGLTLVVNESSATEAGIEFDGVFRMLTLTVHSSLQAVGLTAAVANKLTEKGISANVIAAYYHDHVFVQADKAELALDALQELRD